MTDGRTTTYSEREHEFTFAKNNNKKLGLYLNNIKTPEQPHYSPLKFMNNKGSGVDGT